jgi:hypothetical protein
LVHDFRCETAACGILMGKWSASFQIMRYYCLQ